MADEVNHGGALPGGRGSGRARTDPVEARARALMESGQPEQAAEILVSEAAVVATRDPGRASALRSEAGNLLFLRYQAGTALDHVRRARSDAGERTPTTVLVSVAIAETLCACPEADDSLDAAVNACHVDGDYLHAGVVAWHLVIRGRFDDADALIDRALAVVSAARTPGALGLVLRSRAELRWWRGAWAAARMDALEALGLHRRAGHRSAEGYALALLARLDAAEGRDADCSLRAGQARAVAGATGADGIACVAAAALGLAALGRGQHELAAEEFDHAASVLRSGGVLEPAAVPCAGDHVEALMLAGRGEDATVGLGRLEHCATVSEQVYGRAIAARARGQLMPDDHAEARLRDSLRLLDDAERPFERARTQLALAAHLRRARRRGEAQEHARSALTAFEQLGARDWSGQARRELRLTSAAHLRLPAPMGHHALTEQEKRVAELAARGSSNREIAAALSVSAKTVEFHLGNAFRKLDVRRRSQLRDALRGEAD